MNIRIMGFFMNIKNVVMHGKVMGSMNIKRMESNEYQNNEICYEY